MNDHIIRSTTTIQPVSLGVCAQDILRNESSAAVQGITSAGIFLRTEKGKIVFLTDASWRGPLTINMPDLFKASDLQTGAQINLAYPNVIFPNFNVMINGVTRVWQPEPLEIESLDLDPVFQRAEQISAALSFERKFLPFYEVLETIADTDHNLPEKRARISAWFYIKGRDQVHDKALALKRFVGLGTGLTPSGDDFIVGFLLAAHYLHFRMDQEIETILAEAHQKTTALSANLMTCAARGYADERLVGALRFLLTGEKGCTEVKKELLSYGSSSGIETLAGMLTAIFLLD